MLNFNWLWKLLRGELGRRSMWFCLIFVAKVLRLNLKAGSFLNFNHCHLTLTTFPLAGESPSRIFTHPYMCFSIRILLIFNLRNFNHSPSKRRWNYLLLWCRLRWKFDNHDDRHLSRDLVVPLPCPRVSFVLEQPLLSNLLCVCLVTQRLHRHFPDLSTFHYINLKYSS